MELQGQDWRSPPSTPSRRFFFQPNNAIGVTLSGSRSVYNGLLNANITFDIPRTSLKVVFNWAGYSHVPPSQVQYSATTGLGPTTITVGQLSKRVANATRTFMRRAEDGWVQDNVRDPTGRYRIGRGPGRISEDDVLVLGILFVSPGAVMPLLQLRPGFNLSP